MQVGIWWDQRDSKVHQIQSCAGAFLANWSLLGKHRKAACEVNTVNSQWREEWNLAESKGKGASRASIAKREHLKQQIIPNQINTSQRISTLMNVFFDYIICTKRNPAHQNQSNAIRRLLPVWWIASHRLGSAPLRTSQAPWPATGAHGRIWWLCERPVLRFLSRDTVAVWSRIIVHTQYMELHWLCWTQLCWKHDQKIFQYPVRLCGLRAYVAPKWHLWGWQRSRNTFN